MVWFQLRVYIYFDCIYNVHCVLFGFSYTYISTLIASTMYICIVWFQLHVYIYFDCIYNVHCVLFGFSYTYIVY